MPDTPEKDVVAEARELLVGHNAGKVFVLNSRQYDRLPELLNALCDEVEHARRALKGMVELWDANNPDDPCGCVGASDDCKHPPICELCVARLITEGRTKELFE